MNFKKLLVSRQKKNNEQRKKKSFQTRLERFDTLPSSAEMDPIW